jgi:hypothetical protein
VFVVSYKKICIWAAYEILDLSSLMDILIVVQVNDDVAKFNLLLKVKRGEKEEKFKVEVHKNNEGSFRLNQMEVDHS